MSHTLFLVNHSLEMSPAVAGAIFLAGYLCICINYDADRQRAHARATGGACTIWGRKPTMIEARYVTETGQKKSSLLLVSGWWAVSRHFHYLPELAAAFFWSAPAGFTHFMPYFYLAFLTPLLFDRGEGATVCGGSGGQASQAGMAVCTHSSDVATRARRVGPTCSCARECRIVRGTAEISLSFTSGTHQRTRFTFPLSVQRFETTSAAPLSTASTGTSTARRCRTRSSRTSCRRGGSDY